MRIFYALLTIVFLSSAVFAATYKISPNTKTSTPIQNVHTYQINENYSADDNFPIIEIIADYSGSMGKSIDSVRTKITSITSTLPANTKLGLRVAGVGTNDNCSTSTALVLPVSSYSVNKIENALYRYNAIAPVEPLTLSIDLAVHNDLSAYSQSMKKKIILITDGHETCPADPCSLIKKIMSTRNDIVIDIIFTHPSDTSRLRCLADTTGGKIYKVKNEKNKIYQNGKVIIETDPIADALKDSMQASVEQTSKKVQKYEYIENMD